MILKTMLLPIKSGRPVIALNELDANELGVFEGDRVLVRHGRKRGIFSVQIAEEIVHQGYLGVTDFVLKELSLEIGSDVEVFPARKPKSVEFIKKKIAGKKLEQDELRAIVFDIVNNALSDIEIASFVISSMLRGMDFDEIEWLTRAMIESGERLQFDKGTVVDKHSIGGVPGRRSGRSQKGLEA
ncbi:MAG: phosphorylase [Archaeoglobaceae archaeon]|nr:phosphorylase [Archaeoglobaceae archaeon]